MDKQSPTRVLAFNEYADIAVLKAYNFFEPCSGHRELQWREHGCWSGEIVYIRGFVPAGDLGFSRLGVMMEGRIESIREPLEGLEVYSLHHDGTMLPVSYDTLVITNSSIGGMSGSPVVDIHGLGCGMVFAGRAGQSLATGLETIQEIISQAYDQLADDQRVENIPPYCPER